jgi:hypothetical protein
MTTESNVDGETSSSRIGWTDGLLGIVAGSGAGLCCTGPLFLGALGFSGLAGTLAALPFVYHVILQWIAVTILIGTWTWFLYKWFQLPKTMRWNRAPILTGIILLGVSLYVLRSWATHVLI